MSTEYGYARVSSIDQNEVRQLDALRAVGIADELIARARRGRSCAWTCGIRTWRKGRCRGGQA